MLLPLIGVIPLLPFAGFLLCGLLGKRLGKGAVTAIGCGSVLLSFLVSVGAVLELPSGAIHAVRYWTWIPSMPFETSGPPLEVAFGFRLDALSAIMILIVTGVGFLIHVYSTGYMKEDPGYARYFAYLNLFTAMMLTLVLGGNFLVMFVGWEGVGLCSYLLIGFWFEDAEKAQAGRKAFITNRIGDFAFILALLAILLEFHSLDFHEVMTAIAGGDAPVWLLTLVGLALFAGACGKSAQIPLFVWLPDAMAGPTPVSALIHAATMVTAGVYMVSRCSVLYVHAPLALTAVALVGAATALLAATIGLAQHDIKKVLAYSTISQLGYMFLGAGVGAFAGSIFHLMTHAFFKALLFLGAGSVIHAMGGEQDMRRMGALRRKLPWTYRTMLVGALAIAGIPVLAGFFSKDEILWSAWGAGHPVLWLVGVLGAGLTAFYMFRLIYLTFHGEYRGTDEQAHHLHESPPSMLAPLLTLAFLSIVGGWVGIPHALGRVAGIPNVLERYLAPALASADAHSEVARPAAPHGTAEGPPEERGMAPSQEPAHGPSEPPGTGSAEEPGAREVGGTALEHADAETTTGGSSEYVLMLISVVAAVLGILLARRFYRRPSDLPARVAAGTGPLYELVRGKYWVDEIYEATVLRTYRAACGLFDRFDRWIVDGLVNAVAAFTEMVGQILRLFQTGFVRNYALLIFVGAVALVWMLGR